MRAAHAYLGRLFTCSAALKGSDDKPNRGMSTRSSAETWRCMLCDEQNLRRHRRCQLCSSVNPESESSLDEGGSFSKASRRVRDRAKRFTGSASATTRAVSSQISNVGRKKFKRLPPKDNWTLFSDAVVHSEGKRQQKRCFLVLTKSDLFIRNKAKVAKEREAKEKGKARTIALDTIKRIKEVEGLDTPGIELYMESPRATRLTGSLRLGKRASARQSKTVLFFNEAIVRNRWVVELRKALTSRSAGQETKATAMEDIRTVVRAGERYNIPLRFLGDKASVTSPKLSPSPALTGKKKEEDASTWALYVRKHTPKEEDFSWSVVVSDLGKMSSL